MNFRQSQIQTFQCTVCRQYLNEDNLRDTSQQVVLFGAKPWAVCPCCHQEVDKKMIKNRAYRKRALAWVNKLKK